MSLLLLFAGAGTPPPPGNSGSLSETLESLALSASGQVVISGALSGTLEALALTAAGQVIVSGSLSETLAALTLSGTVTTVSISGSLDAVLDALVLSALANNGVQVPAPLRLVAESLSSGLAVNASGTPGALSSFATGQPYASGASAIYAVRFLDATGVGIPAEALTSLRLTLVDKGTGGIVNGLQDVSVLNVDRGTLDQSGHLTINFSATDMGAVGAPLSGMAQYRSMVLDWTYNSGLAGRHQVDFTVLVLAEV